jgi:very-short-patch-repair endonuclease
MLFTSLKAEDIKITDTSSNGLKTFQRYLLYAETGRLETGHITGRDFDSEFERAVYDVLQKRGYAVDKQVGEHGFFIDLAVKHKKNNACYALGIECDGAPYHSAKSARDRDYIRQNILESLGWRIYRIWSTDWYHNQKEEIKKLEHYLETLMQQDPTVKSVSALSRTQALPFRHTSKQDMNEPITNPDMPNAIQVSEDLQIDNA